MQFVALACVRALSRRESYDNSLTNSRPGSTPLRPLQPLQKPSLPPTPCRPPEMNCPDRLAGHRCCCRRRRRRSGVAARPTVAEAPAPRLIK